MYFTLATPCIGILPHNAGYHNTCYGKFGNIVTNNSTSLLLIIRVIAPRKSLLTVLGLPVVVIDPTTTGAEDSNRAMGYEQPWDDEVHYDG